jgi:hypothetical protein
MGTLKYDGVAVEFDDRLLAHLELVMVQKMRRQESFLMSWNDAEEMGGGRTSIWIHHAVKVTFHFTEAGNRSIDRPWLEKLMASANSPTGLFVTDVEGSAAHPASGTRFV